LQTCPKLPLSQKVEVLVENFDATGVTKAQAATVSNSLSATANEHWVTVSPKKRGKAMIQAKPKGNSILNPVRDNNFGGNVQPSSSTSSLSTTRPL